MFNGPTVIFYDSTRCSLVVYGFVPDSCVTESLRHHHRRPEASCSMSMMFTIKKSKSVKLWRWQLNGNIMMPATIQIRAELYETMSETIAISNPSSV